MVSTMKLIAMAALCLAVCAVKGQPFVPHAPEYKQVLRCREKLERVYGPADSDHGIITGASFAIKLEPFTGTRRFDPHKPFTWPAGTSQLILSAETGVASGIDVHLSTKTCRDASLNSLATSHRSGEPLEYESSVKAGMNNNMTFDWDEVVDYENIASVLVLLKPSGSLAGCCNLEPFMPDLPEVWSVTIEANMVDKGYGFFQHEYHDGENSRLRVDVNIRDQKFVQVDKFHPNETPSVTVITPANRTHPVTCHTVPRRRAEAVTRFQMGADKSMLTTAEWLAVDESMVEYIPPADSTNRLAVRGVPVEVWREQMSTDFTDMQGWRVVGEYSVDYHFLAAFFMHPQDFYHRQLWRVTLNGSSVTTPPDGQPVANDVFHVYDFVGFRPGIDHHVSFDPCDIAPEGAGCCPPMVDGQASTSTSEQPAGSSDAVSIPYVDADGNDDCGSGYDSSQSGLYAAFSIMGIVLGTGLGAVIALLLTRRSPGVGRGAGKGPSIRNGMEMSDNPMAAGDDSAKGSSMEMTAAASGAQL